jgi:hypothetical protein
MLILGIPRRLIVACGCLMVLAIPCGPAWAGVIVQYKFNSIVYASGTVSAFYYRTGVDTLSVSISVARLESASLVATHIKDKNNLGPWSPTSAPPALMVDSALITGTTGGVCVVAEPMTNSLTGYSLLLTGGASISLLDLGCGQSCSVGGGGELPGGGQLPPGNAIDLVFQGLPLEEAHIRIRVFEESPAVPDIVVPSDTSLIDLVPTIIKPALEGRGYVVQDQGVGPLDPPFNGDWATIRLVSFDGNPINFIREFSYETNNHTDGTDLGYGIVMSKVDRPEIPPLPPGPLFRRGDADASFKLELTDPVNLLNYLFLGGARLKCMDAADFDDNGSLDITDAVASLGYQFLGTAAPPAPGPASCGPDANEEVPDLGCDFGC